MLDGTTAYDDDGTDDTSSTGTADSHRWLELRCVLAVVRHGDRTPKQKMKVTVTQVRNGQVSPDMAYLQCVCGVMSVLTLDPGEHLSQPVHQNRAQLGITLGTCV